ncbi:MAG: DUF4345 domain-containing protein [Crocinitomicaceae bacterium]|nr:DUF4345 domain-containing protein [Flavobacteriales bacterium]NQZ36420.1 DUF4345 domain-containing protein [Crocinitomicaceae bacterium]
MKNLIKVLLVVSGLTGIIIGSGLLFAPVSFEASAGIDLGTNINLLSEVRAPGGALLVAGVLILLGAFMTKLAYTSVLLSSLIYLSYGFSRVFSMIVDGVPSESLVTATIVEIVVGGLSFLVLVNFQKNQDQTDSALKIMK